MCTQSRVCGSQSSDCRASIVLVYFNSKMADVVENNKQPKDNQSAITEEITNDELPNMI